MNDKVEYTPEELANIEKILKDTMDTGEQELFDKLSAEDKKQYLSGFGDNIREWQKAKEMANNPQDDDNLDGGEGEEEEEDGLDHWKPVKRQKSQLNGNQSSKKNSNKVFGDLDKDLEDLDNQSNLEQQNAQDRSSSNSDATTPLDIANNAKSIAESAQKIADGAQKAAEAAQLAANQADANAQESRSNSDITNADKAQVSANTAAGLADQAQQAANKAKEMADKAQEAANNGDMDQAAEYANAAYDSAMDAANKMGGAKLNAKEAIKSAKKTTGDNDATQQDISGMNGSDAADAAQEAAELALQAADAAQDAAMGAVDNAKENGTKADMDAAEQAKKQADKASEAAAEAQKAARAAQHAANAGNDELAKQQADAAMNAARKAQAAQQKAMEKLGNQPNNQDVDDSGTDPYLEKVPDGFDPDGELVQDEKMDVDMTFDANDFAGNNKELIDKLHEIAEQAGQPLDPEDFLSPEEYGAKKFNEAKEALKSWTPLGGGTSAGSFGNSPNYIVNVLKELFEPVTDWRAQFLNFLTDKTPEGHHDIMAKRRMGLDPGHPLYKSRYLRPNLETFDKLTGLALVFFLVDASGSMGIICGDGVNIFEHIMAELIQIELAVKIRLSAYATFNAGPIYRDDIMTWTYQDATNEADLIEQFKLPVAGGGTSVITAIKNILEFDDLYSLSEPRTLLVVVTDGYDYYKDLNKICKDPNLVEHMIWIITVSDDSHFEKVQKELVEQGVIKEHIICVNVFKEWGATIEKH